MAAQPTADVSISNPTARVPFHARPGSRLGAYVQCVIRFLGEARSSFEFIPGFVTVL